MYELIITLFKTKFRLSRKLFDALLGIYNSFRRTLNKKPIRPSSQFYSSNFDRFPRIECEEVQPFEVVYVSANKDFTVLGVSLRRILKLYTPKEVPLIRVIVPAVDYESCLTLIGDTNYFPRDRSIDVISEEKYFEKSTVSLIKNKIPERFGWVIQQFLKLEAVLESKENNVLIIDSDTILTQKREFVFKNKKQLLLPSDEFNIDYYRNLQMLFGLKTSSKYSFVSHHLLFQKDVLAEILQNSKCQSIDDFAVKVLSESELTSSSPFSVDYELYSQFLLSNYPQRVQLSRWGNLSLRRSDFFLKLADTKLINILGLFFFSISLHSWAQ